jgi:hypothetical protein
MRWLFCEPGAADYPAKAAAQQRIEAWWQAFVPRKENISAIFSQEQDWDLPGWMDETLQAVHPELMWEYGPAVRGEGHRLVITPEAARHLRPLAMAVVKSAPQIAGWEFYNYRLPEDIEQAENTVRGRCGGTIAGIQVRPCVGAGHRVDLQFFSPRARHGNDEDALAEIYVATEALLGEELLDHWIGAIDVDPLPKAGLLGGMFGKPKPTNMLPLSRLHDTVQAVIQSITDQLQPQPLWQTIASQQWCVYNGQPVEADDYADRDDVLSGGTIDGELAVAMQPHHAFFSGRFSRAKERFCYLKIDGEGGDIQARFEARGALEDAINDALAPRKIGCHIGGATGLRYTYVDLALVDVRQAIEVLRPLLQGTCSQRSWLLFHDADLCGEWVGIYPDSPVPPVREEE